MSNDENTADIVTRLRDWRSLHLTRLGSLFDEAASHIELLEAAYKSSGSALAVIDGAFKSAVAEIARLRLTDAEREAIEVAAAAYAGDHGEWFATTLRGLLERFAQFGIREPYRLQPIANCDSDRSQPIECTPATLSTPAKCTVPPQWTEDVGH